jgi:hypothetical protein
MSFDAKMNFHYYPGADSFYHTRQYNNDFPSNMVLEQGRVVTIPATSRRMSDMTDTTTSAESSASSSSSEARPLPLNHRPHEFSVLCGYGKEHSQATGNKRLKVLCGQFVADYIDAKIKKESKSAIVSQIVLMVQDSCSGQEGFIQYKNKRWWGCDRISARRRVTSTLRDCCPDDRYTSSNAFQLAERHRQKSEARQMIQQARTIVLEQENVCLNNDGDSQWQQDDGELPSMDDEISSLVISDYGDELSTTSSVSPRMFDDESSILYCPDLCNDLVACFGNDSDDYGFVDD